MKLSLDYYIITKGSKTKYCFQKIIQNPWVFLIYIQVSFTLIFDTNENKTAF